MLESVLSSRRSPPSPEDDEDGGGNDESKTRKHAPLAARIAKHVTGLASGPQGQCLAASLLLALILAAAVLLSRSPSIICISPYESLRRTALLGGSLDGLASDFGSLGVPWCRSKHGKTVEWTSKDLLKGLEEFVPIYETRPIKNNVYGMGFDHSFGLWFMTRWLKPDLMIESGAFKGHSTWVLRQAMPETAIISLSPRHPEKYLVKGAAYVDWNCTYFTGKNFVDFGSVDWGSVMKKHGISDLSRVLVFFDDHQNELKRLKEALKAGFQNLIFEDNYDTGTGDHYSLRQICDQFYIRGGGHSCFRDSDEARVRAKRKMFWDKAVDIDELCGEGEGEAWWGVRGQMRDNFNHTNKAISYAEHFQNSRFIESVLDVYWELPPVAGPSLTHQTRWYTFKYLVPLLKCFWRESEGGGHSCFRDSDEARVRAKRKMFWDKAVDIDELCGEGEGEAWWGVRGQMRDNFNHTNKAISYAEHFQNSRFIESVLDVYWELPPVAGPSLTHQTRYDPARASDPIIEDGRFGSFRRLGLSRLETSVFNGYTQMVYLQISGSAA